MKASFYLSEITRMVFIEIDTMMMQTTGITTATRMFPVFA